MDENSPTMDKIVWVNQNIGSLSFTDYMLFMRTLIIYRCIEQKVNDASITQIEMEVTFLYSEVMESYLEKEVKDE